MYKGKIHLIILLLSLCIPHLHAQQTTEEICVDFRVGSMDLDTLYASNSERISNIISFLHQIRQDSTLTLTGISFCGAASPEGSSTINARLSKGRMKAVEKLVRQNIEIPENLVTRNDLYIPWQLLAAMVKQSDMKERDEVLAILHEETHPNNEITDPRINKLKALQNGIVWKELGNRFFSKMRNACVLFITYKKEPEPVEEPEPITKPEPIVETEPVTEAKSESIVMITEKSRHLYLKTNAMGLALGIANVAVELDLAKHWSFTLPVYYSAWNYFKSTLKFRTLALQPEVRYWLNENNEGWFAGAHFGLGYYNYALDGDYRYQDHNRETPAMGGGLAFGYRTHLSKNKRWKMEFSLGAGLYDSCYDKFHNTPDTKDGLMVASSIKKTWFGVDQASVSIAYTFDLKKKGGRK